MKGLILSDVVKELENIIYNIQYFDNSRNKCFFKVRFEEISSLKELRDKILIAGTEVLNGNNTGKNWENSKLEDFSQ